ncbi:MAG: hypothetical protein V1799_17235 [bacterium]
MVIWHNSPDASRIPEHVTSSQEVELWFGTHPIEWGQAVWVEIKLHKVDGKEIAVSLPAQWHSNNEQRNNSYWIARIGEFESGDKLEYEVHGSCGDLRVCCEEIFSFDVS